MPSSSEESNPDTTADTSGRARRPTACEGLPAEEAEGRSSTGATRAATGAAGAGGGDRTPLAQRLLTGRLLRSKAAFALSAGISNNAASSSTMRACSLLLMDLLIHAHMPSPYSLSPTSPTLLLFFHLFFLYLLFLFFLFLSLLSLSSLVFSSSSSFLFRLVFPLTIPLLLLLLPLRLLLPFSSSDNLSKILQPPFAGPSVADQCHDDQPKHAVKLTEAAA